MAQWSTCLTASKPVDINYICTGIKTIGLASELNEYVQTVMTHLCPLQTSDCNTVFDWTQQLLIRCTFSGEIEGSHILLFTYRLHCHQGNRMSVTQCNHRYTIVMATGEAIRKRSVIHPATQASSLSNLSSLSKKHLGKSDLSALLRQHYVCLKL